jgi:hypothetical protein
VRAYDAARLAAAALVRSRDLRVRATNHHEVTLAAAGFVAGGSLAALVGELDELRTLRIEVEYGWASNVSAEDAQNALEIVRRFLDEGAPNLREHRPSLESRIQPPA